MSLAIIVPVGPNEERKQTWEQLLSDLNQVQFPRGTEVYFVGTLPQFPKSSLLLPVQWLVANPGRAIQMNEGARVATLSSHTHLWFLHADSRLSPVDIKMLFRSLQKEPRVLHYFNLKFTGLSSPLICLNEVGARIRSHFAKLPFGDQGFCLAREDWNRLGGFDETVKYGEDHLLIWQAHHRRVRVVCTDGMIRTSARKYHLNGWSRTTARHIYLTWVQAIPQVYRLLQKRLTQRIRKNGKRKK